MVYEAYSGGKISATIWLPAQQPVGVVQIVHGIAEHMARYDDFATYLNSLGYVVVGEDHMGHGATAALGGVKGYFAGGWWAAIQDTYQLMKRIVAQYPQIPYVMFGHSMGSFMVRSILARYPDSGMSGCIVCGTGWQPEVILGAGRALASAICKLSDPQKPNAILHNLAFGAYNKRVDHPRTEHDWLTRDAAIVDAYAADPMCGFRASAGLMSDMFDGIAYIQSKPALEAMNKQLPVLFIAGGDDPVGSYGDGVRKAFDAFRTAGMQNVHMRLYPLGRHEILNEINKNEVYEDVAQWLSGTLK